MHVNHDLTYLHDFQITQRIARHCHYLSNPNHCLRASLQQGTRHNGRPYHALQGSRNFVSCHATRYSVQHSLKAAGCQDCILQQSRSLSVLSKTYAFNSKQSLSKSVIFEGRYKLNCLPSSLIQTRHLSEDNTNIFSDMSDVIFVQWSKDFLISIHDSTGLPWWATIFLSSILLRLVVTLPLFVVSQNNMTRHAMVMREMVEPAKILKKEVFRFSRTHNLTLVESKLLYKQQMKKQYMKKIMEHNCHPKRSFAVVLVQVPVWICMSFAIRDLCGKPLGSLTYVDPSLSYEGLMTGGIFWFTNLAVPDPFSILPVALGGINLFLTEAHVLGAEMRGEDHGLFGHIMKCLFRGLSVYIMYISLYMPSGVVLYWCSSSMYGILQFFALQQPKVRRALGIPIEDEGSGKPLKDLYQFTKKKITGRKD